MRRLQPTRLSRLRQFHPSAQQCPVFPLRSFTTTSPILADDFETEESPTSQPRRSANEKRSLQDEAMNLISSVDDQTLSDDFPDDAPSLPQLNIRRTPDLERGDRQNRRSPPLRPDRSRNAGQSSTRPPRGPKQTSQREQQQGPQRRRKERGRDDLGMSSTERPSSITTGGDDSYSADDYIDEYREQFHSEAEERGYEGVLQTTLDLLQKRNRIQSVQAKPEVQRNPNGDMAKRCEQQTRELDQGIREALVQMEEAKNKAYVPHQPQGVDLAQLHRSKLGAAATGCGGAGNVAEDAVRYLGLRQAHTWRDPKQLARRLASGEFMKFQSHTERKQVHEALQNLAHEEKKPELKSAGFAPLEPEARREVVRRAIAGHNSAVGGQNGRLVEAGKMSGPGDVLDMARRLAGSRYRGEQAEMMLKGIAELLPQERQQQREQGKS